MEILFFVSIFTTLMGDVRKGWWWKA